MPTKSKKTLFIFSDPGGAKPLLSIIENYNDKDYLVISDRNYSFYDEFNVDVKIVVDGYDQIIDDFNPQLIYTATSYKSNIEKEFLRIAKIRNIKSCTYVDHWTSILERFQFQNETFLPTILQVIDDRAKSIAIEQGIPEYIIEIIGNPYHQKIKNWMPNQSKKDFLIELGLPNENYKLLVYAPDPLSNVNGKTVFGFDEIMATFNLVNLFEKEIVNTSWKILIKLHPNQNEGSIKKIVEATDDFIILNENVSNNECIYYADVVIGYFSSFLIEANLFDKPILRYLPFGIKNDPIKELNIGAIVNDIQLKNYLLSND
ncbi:CDP-glycerol glycerophosphotransferase family protein [Flavobacterium urumqiense]|uniref:CDP-Glycerol:Poly(Glycerophosphate) glycerophosphotransferase n=1 Tax=Flavobacterium urumqiense TaxID=935224 RepID=A0A1H5Y2M1_9FLAO|nr:CDP-glycerol glycerophosphotransferase family protein [Flavobacterium urumqiense]SEG17937.1 CDP-Glycerol:Poly(glycerophosphate) glycerophosphotransferase [Flavobacterium urumqiense]